MRKTSPSIVTFGSIETQSALKAKTAIAIAIGYLRVKIPKRSKPNPIDKIAPHFWIIILHLFD